MTLTQDKIERLRMKALFDYGRGVLDEKLAGSGQAGRVYRRALHMLADQDEAHERRQLAATSAKVGGKLSLNVHPTEELS